MYKIPRFRPFLSKRTILNILKYISFAPAAVNKRKNSEFEEKFAEYLGVKNVVSVPSGRVGFSLILKNLGLEKGSQVALSAFNYWAVPRMISLMNLEPLFIDIDLDTCNIDSRKIEEKITKTTKVILATHLYGLPCPLEEILAIAKKNNLLVIEDCVQAFGAEYKGRKAGSFGEAAYFGFGITKDLLPLGGGIIATNNDSLAEKIRQDVSAYTFLNKREVFKKALKAMVMKMFTQPFVFSYCVFPYIYMLRFAWGLDIVDGIFEEKEKVFARLPESFLKLVPQPLQAELGLEQIAHLGLARKMRIKNAKYFLNKLEGMESIKFSPCLKNGGENIFTNFPVRTKHRDFLARELLKRGIDTSFGYIRAFGDFSCYNSAMLERSILHIPVYSYLKETELSYIAGAVKEILEKVK